MSNNDISIWINSNTNKPICQLDTAKDFITNGKKNNSLYVLNTSIIFDKIPKGLISFRQLINYGPNKYLIFPSNIAKDIKHYFRHKPEILEYELILFALIHSINNEISSWRSFLSSDEGNTKEIIKDLKNFKKDEEQLKQVLEKYFVRYMPKGEVQKKYEMESITFNFSDTKPAIKISNSTLISSIFDCIRSTYNFEIPIGFDYALMQTDYKQKTALKIFEFINNPNPFIYIPTKNIAYETISDFFSFSGEKTNNEQIKTWIKRAKKK